MRVWIDDVLLDDPYAPALSVLDHAVTVGDGVFETVKAVHGRPFALTRHLRRLAASAAGLGLPEVDEQRLRAAVAAVLDGVDDPAVRVRITVTGGVSPLGSGRGGRSPTLIVAAGDEIVESPPAAIVTVPWVKNERGAVTGLKTTSYAENVVALAHARSRDASEAIFANSRAELCEGTGSNVFAVLDGELVTPPPSSGCLAGITRALVIEWCGATERVLRMSALDEATELFLTSTTRDVQPVRRCDDRELAAPGSVTAGVRQVWADRAAQDLDP
ncbi:MAG: aminotransferase class IV [Nocardioidaceae bacterium]